MHPRVIAARREVALRDMVEASVRLAEKLGLPDSASAIANVKHRDAQIRDVLRYEALAAFLADLGERVKVDREPASTEFILGKLEEVGVSDSWRESIRKKFDEAEPTEETEGE